VASFQSQQKSEIGCKLGVNWVQKNWPQRAFVFKVYTVNSNNKLPHVPWILQYHHIIWLDRDFHPNFFLLQVLISLCYSPQSPVSHCGSLF